MSQRRQPLPCMHLLDWIVFTLWVAYLPKINKSILSFFWVGVISLLTSLFRFSMPEVLIGGLYLLRWLIYSSFSNIKIQLFKLLPILGFGMAILGLGQYLLFPDIRGLFPLGWDLHYYRVVGTLLDPGFIGLIFVFTLVYLIFNNFPKITWILTYVALALTYSRASYLAFFIAFSWVSYQKKTWKFFLLSLCLITVTVTVLPRTADGEGVKLERTSSVWARAESWKTAWNIFTQNPILGVGFNTYRYAQGASAESHAGAGSDSSLLLVLATTGIVGFVFYIKYLKYLWKLGKNDLVLSASLVAVFIHSFFLNSQFYPHVVLWIALLLQRHFQLFPQDIGRPIRNHKD